MKPLIADALQAYVKAAMPVENGLAPRQTDSAAFSDLVADAARSALETGHKAERMTAAAVDGKAELAEVVAAVSNAELTLQSVVAIRDRIIQAYQEILRMPI